MFDKVYKTMLWIGIFLACIYMVTGYSILGFIGGITIFLLAIITVIHDYRNGTMPFQKQREFLREQGLALKKSDLKRNTQNRQENAPEGMKRVKKRDIK